MGGSHAQGLGQILHGLIDMLGHLVGGLFISRREGATLMPTTAPATSPVVMPHQNCPLLISIPPFSKTHRGRAFRSYAILPQKREKSVAKSCWFRYNKAGIEMRQAPV